MTGVQKPKSGPWTLATRYRTRASEAGPTGRWEAEIASVRVVFGVDRLRDLGDLACEIDAQRVLLVSDQGLRSAGHLERAEAALRSKDLQVVVFDQVDENPSSLQIEGAVAFAAAHEPDCIVALGGGSVMDCAKGINFLLTNGGRMIDYWGFGRASKPLLPALGVPTTAGTGSEAQSFALISDSGSHRKMACGDPTARFRSVILDPSLLASVPRSVAAASGLDAVAHAVESYVTTRHNPVSRMLSRQAWLLLHRGLEQALKDREDLAAGGQLLLGAHLAGAAIEQSMLGAAHACANPLTAAFDLSHGLAVALMLPQVVRFNAEIAEDDYRELLESAAEPVRRSGSQLLAGRLEELRTTAGFPDRLREVGVLRSELPALAEAASLEWTARFNPRPVSQAELLSIYEAAF